LKLKERKLRENLKMLSRDNREENAHQRKAENTEDLNSLSRKEIRAKKSKESRN